MVEYPVSTDSGHEDSMLTKSKFYDSGRIHQTNEELTMCLASITFSTPWRWCAPEAQVAIWSQKITRLVSTVSRNVKSQFRVQGPNIVHVRRGEKKIRNFWIVKFSKSDKLTASELHLIWIAWPNSGQKFHWPGFSIFATAGQSERALWQITWRAAKTLRYFNLFLFSSFFFLILSVIDDCRSSKIGTVSLCCRRTALANTTTYPKYSKRLNSNLLHDSPLSRDHWTSAIIK